MDCSLNIVDLIEKNPITKLSQTYNNHLLEKVKNNFTESQQQLFISSFYCYLNYNKTADFIIDLDNIWQWLGFSTKQKARILLEKNFVIEKDYKFLVNQQVNQDKEQHGGHNKQKFLLNIKTFKLLCIKAETKKANEIHEYFVKLEEILHETLEEESNELKQQLEINKKEKKELENKFSEIEEENKLLQIRETIPIIYIYNTTPLSKEPILKIGYTTKNIHERIKSYLTPNGKGKLEFTIEVPDNNVTNFEKYIHGVFSRYLIKSEVFQIDVEEAKMIIYRIVNTLTLMNIKNDDERKIKISKLYLNELEIIENKPKEIKITRDMSTQTEIDENTYIPIINNEKDELTKNFDKFVQEHCITRDDVEISSTDIMGQYRIVTQSASKEIFHSFKVYLDIRFKQYRLKVQDKNQVVNGYMGVTLKELKYEKSEILSNPQNFIFHACIFSPSGKVLFSDLINEYKKWKQQIKLPIFDTDEKELKTYLKSTNYVIFMTLWCNNGSGQGYYGLSLKKDIDNHRKTSSTGKKIQKYSIKGDLLGTWESIAKAAESEKICAAKMSRSVKNKVVFNNDYYYCIYKEPNS
jgi:phage anti-repressor protein|uniref:Bacteriophage T5 Orf172 DNA-binding domain-containing protein n=1 Tax=viral metagenome TaxID=1070528 RepID=A0A6C0HTM2_9ZZZZ